MKKKLLLLFIMLSAGLALFLYARQAQETEGSDLVKASIEALAYDEIPSNFGPAEQVRCLNGGHKKICLCKKDFPPCTESDCY